MVNRNRLLNTFLELAAVDSPTYSEREISEKIISILKPIGFKLFMDDAGDRLGGNCGNLYAILEGDNKELEPLLFSAHMDTVMPCLSKHPVVEKDGKIHSDGTTIIGADDLSAVAEILEAVSVIHENQLKHRTIELLFSVAEETHCEGSRLFDFSKIKSRQCYVLDYDGEIGTAANAAPAKIGFTAEIIGKAAHAGFAPEQGKNAIAAMAQAVTQIKQGRVSETATVNIGTISGGTAINIVPDKCVINGEIRDLTTENALKIAEEIRTQIELACSAYGTVLNFEYNILYSSYFVEEHNPVVLRYKNACDKLEINTALATTFGGSDNNIFYDKGITGIVMANGMKNCHSTDEYTNINDMEQAAKILVSLMTSD